MRLFTGARCAAGTISHVHGSINPSVRNVFAASALKTPESASIRPQTPWGSEIAAAVAFQQREAFCETFTFQVRSFFWHPLQHNSAAMAPQE